MFNQSNKGLYLKSSPLYTSCFFSLAFTTIKEGNFLILYLSTKISSVFLTIPKKILLYNIKILILYIIIQIFYITNYF